MCKGVREKRKDIMNLILLFLLSPNNHSREKIKDKQ
jgi:hypothetical protein